MNQNRVFPPSTAIAFQDFFQSPFKQYSSIRSVIQRLGIFRQPPFHATHPPLPFTSQTGATRNRGTFSHSLFQTSLPMQLPHDQVPPPPDIFSLDPLPVLQAFYFIFLYLNSYSSSAILHRSPSPTPSFHKIIDPIILPISSWLIRPATFLKPLDQTPFN